MAIVNLQGRSEEELKALFLAANDIKNPPSLFPVIAGGSRMRTDSNADEAETRARLERAGATVEVKPYTRGGQVVHELVARFD